MKEIEVMSQHIREELAQVEQCMAEYKRRIESQAAAEIKEFETTIQTISNELMALRAYNDEKERELERAQTDIVELRRYVDKRKEERQVRTSLQPKATKADEMQSEPELMDKIRTTSSIVKDLTKAVQMYEKRTGMQIKRLDDAKIQINFRCITRERPDQLHSFTVSVVAERYHAESTSHTLLGLDALVEEVNATGDFCKFVRDVRRLFKQLYA